jgi:hypothetical protein
MLKLDYKKAFKMFYSAAVGKPVFVQVPSFRYLMIDGTGDPNTAVAAREAIETLFPMAYAIKFKIKKELKIDYSVMPLEGLWWADDMNSFLTACKAEWKWTYMINQPEVVDEDIYKQVMFEVNKKKNLPAFSRLRFEILEEGYSAQIMHIGSFSEEGKKISILHNYILENGYKINGLANKHHEIYLSDYRKTAPEKLKTIIRQPVMEK